MNAESGAKNEAWSEVGCDLCGNDAAAEIEVARNYTGGQPLHVCRNCGFVYVRRRRSADAIAADWSDEIYGEGYTARIPAVRARQVYVAEMIASTIGLAGKSVCDIGGGEGQFLDIIRGPDYNAQVFAIEPSQKNCQALTEMGIEAFAGTIEDYIAQPDAPKRKYDIVTIIWTLENCQSCMAMLDAARNLLVDGGHVVVATGSRILVPFKKPLQYYLSRNPADTHSFRFSANTLTGVLAESGFQVTQVNRYFDSDILCAVGKKAGPDETIDWKGDDWTEVVDFFDRWHRETQAHFAET